jgi:RNA polymerase sigma factor (sigma-70 family)
MGKWTWSCVPLATAVPRAAPTDSSVSVDGCDSPGAVHGAAAHECDATVAAKPPRKVFRRRGTSTQMPRLHPALDERELTRIHRQYRDQILRRCRRILRDAHTAEDATQMVFMKLWRYGESFRLADCQLGWLYRVADRCCFDELRRRALPSDAASTERLALPARVTDAVEDRDLVRRFLGRFDDRVKQVVVMRYCEEMSQDEIADETRWSRQTVCTKLGFVRERAEVLRASLCGER